jgi:intracellular septation protein A
MKCISSIIILVFASILSLTFVNDTDIRVKVTMVEKVPTGFPTQSHLQAEMYVGLKCKVPFYCMPTPTRI